MSDNKVFLFGSFTEDESRLFQSKSVQKSNASPSQKEKLNQTVEKIDLQFGSLDVVSLNSVKRFVQEPKQTSRLVKLKNVESPTLLTKSTAVENGKSPVNSNLQNDSKAQAKLISNGLSVSGIADNGKDALDINSSHLCEETTQDVETPVVDPKLTDALAIANGVASEAPKDVNEIIQNPMPLKPAVSIGKELHDLALPAKNLLPRGLVNLGNLCFLNATLQALLSCPPFVQLLQDLANRDIPKIGYPTLLAFVEFITDFGIPDNSKATKPAKVLQLGKPFSPAMFDHVLKIFTPDLPTSVSGRPRQEDAQEFLSFVMDQMHDELLKLQGHLSSSNGGRLPLVSSSEEDGWETVGPKNKSAVTRTQSFIPSELSSIFGGQLRSVVKARGNKASATVQPFLLLHLDILPDAVHTIEDALHLFSARETLEGYRASAGKTGVVSASKSVKIQTLSKILILHLMRFSYGSRGSAKLHKPVHFPLELVLARELLVTPTSEGRKYELVATITHHGQDPSKGHYTADTRFSSEQWLRYDDSYVTAVGTNKVLHDQAYVLFYKQL